MFGAMAPTRMPISRPTAETATATLGSESLLQESLRITVLMTRSIGPSGRLGPGPSGGPCVTGRPAGPADPGGSVGWMDTCATRAIPPLTDLRCHGRRRLAAPPGPGLPDASLLIG